MGKRLNDVAVQELTTPKPDMLLHVFDKDDLLDKRMQFSNLMKPVQAAGIPAIIPSRVGQMYIDTANLWRYIAYNTSAITDWHLVYAEGILTVAAGGGDIVLNLGGNWNNNIIDIHISDIALDYFSGNLASPQISTTHRALTGSYTGKELLSHKTIASGNYHDALIKTTNVAGYPKAATNSAITFHDDGITTAFVKFIIRG